MNSTLSADHHMWPLCRIYARITATIYNISPAVQTIFIFIIVIQIISCPFIVVFNALVMLAVKLKSRLRTNKSNILLASLACTDFMVGAIVQPAFIGLTVYILLLDEASSWLCPLQTITATMTSWLCDSSLIHLALISGERYLAMKRPFAYNTLVTEARLLLASALAWLLSLTVNIPVASGQTLFLSIKHVLHFISICFIIFCHVQVYRETRRHQLELAAQQVTREAREQFEKNRKAFKLTRTILLVLVLCYVPVFISRLVSQRNRGKNSPETILAFFFVAVSMMLLNSLLNPIIYSVRMREFRITFIELICRTISRAEAEEIEKRIFGGTNAVVRLETGPQNEGQDQRKGERASVHNSDNCDMNVLSQPEHSGVPGVVRSRTI